MGYNGSEYINHTVARLLNKLLVEQTKSRARKTNDNALVESKNGAVIRKHVGYDHIPCQWARAFNQFNSTLFKSVFELPSAWSISLSANR